MPDDGMISVEEARARSLAVMEPPPAETRALPDALGQVLAEDVFSGLTIPPLDNTSMDGYAVRAIDTRGASERVPRTLEVIGEVAAGYIFNGHLGAGVAVRIITVAPIP